MRIIQCEPGRHLGPMLAIFNDSIANSTALYDYKPRTVEMMTGWFDAKARASFPVIGVESDSGELMGFASYGAFRNWPAYKYTVEHSVYVDARFRRQGIGRLLLENLIEAARNLDYHVLVGVIDAANEASIALHENLGFARCGTMRQVGFKFGRWLDVVFYELILTTAENPVEG